MSQPLGDQRGWTWDPDSRQYYYYDARNDTLVFQNGRTVRRPANLQIPRTSFNSAGSQAPATPSDHSATNRNYSTSSQAPYHGQPSSYGPQNPASVGSVSPQQQAYGTSGPRPSVSTVTQGLQGTTIQDQQSQGGAQPPPQHKAAPVPPQVLDRDGQRVVTAKDPYTDVQTIFQTTPVEAITDPELLRSGIWATRRLIAPDDNVTERLFESFRRRDQPRKFFTIGKVFLVLWVEPAGESVLTNFEPGTHLGKFGERVFSKVRRFVVIREADNYCTCLPIASYGKRGVGKQGVKKSEHSIIHTTKDPPEPLPAELPQRGEAGMRPQAIRIDSDDPVDKLDNVSRLDYGKVYTIQHNIKVRSFGKVNPKSMNALVHQFGNVWSSSPVLGQAGPSREQSEVKNTVTVQRDSRSSQARGNRSERSGASTGSQGGAGPSTSSRQPGSDPAQEALRVKARAAIQQLVNQGYTEAQAVKAFNEAARQQQAKQTDADADSDEDEDEDDGEAAEDTDDDEPAPRGSAPSGGSRGQSSRQPQKSAVTQSGSRLATSSQIKQQGPSKTSASTSSPAVGQAGPSRQAASSSQQQALSSNSRTQSVTSGRSNAQAQTETARALMAHLLGQGYTEAQATEMVRARFSSGRTSR